MSNIQPLLGQVAIVTGAAKGIGRAIAVRLAESGADIVVADIDVANMPVTAQAIEAHGRRAVTLEADMRKESDIDRMVDQALQSFGRLDIVVNNAGINAPGGFLGVSRQDIRSVFDTDLIGPFMLSQRAAREMIKAGIRGRIVCISSIHSVVPHYCPHYSAAKIGLEQLVIDMALELAPYGIRANAIRPGGIAIRGRLETDSPDVANPNIPYEGRNGLPSEVAALAHFLVTEDSHYITGATVTIDGALSRMTYSALARRRRLAEEQHDLGFPIHIPGPVL
ncbi:MAG: SDR family oxidoreductase [Chloroflexi bacterium]|nr:SDR family oxidoreductase [Chloroflexota bacterium]